MLTLKVVCYTYIACIYSYQCIYLHIHSVLRKKLSKRLNACVLDRPCSEACGHRFGSDVWWVLLVNIGFTLLNMFHLAYLGVMFGGSVEDESADLELEVQCIYVYMFTFCVPGNVNKSAWFDYTE